MCVLKAPIVLYFLYCKCVLYENSYSTLLILHHHYKPIKVHAYSGALQKSRHESCGLNKHTALTLLMLCVYPYLLYIYSVMNGRI